ncbi:MAG: tRNA-dihydrouridine synthase, partial [Candidatus Margulisbacteria bacterium]|nr:tRNA-dihydrouridine synthase [Candidatus Margulisiibacteriota bacterium]
DDKTINVIDLAKIAEQEGIAAVTLHPRTRSQMFKGKADWSLIKKLKREIKIPVIGSGDIKSPEDAQSILTQTGCDALMIGRAAIGNPWLFSQVIEYLKTGKLIKAPEFTERIQIFLKHARLMLTRKAELRAMREMRKFAPKYLKEEPGVGELRKKINQIEKYSELEGLLLPMIR